MSTKKPSIGPVVLEIAQILSIFFYIKTQAIVKSTQLSVSPLSSTQSPLETHAFSCFSTTLCAFILVSSSNIDI